MNAGRDSRALPVPSRSSGGADSPRWTDRGHFKIIGASATGEASRVSTFALGSLPHLMEDADVLSYTVSDKNALCQMRCRGNSRQEVLRRVRKPAQSLRCSKCGADSTPDAKFCADCGAPLGTSGASPEKSNHSPIRVDTCGNIPIVRTPLQSANLRERDDLDARWITQPVKQK